MIEDRLYFKLISKLLSRGKISRDDRILIVCAGHADYSVFQSLGFREVTISNLDKRMNETSFLPIR